MSYDAENRTGARPLLGGQDIRDIARQIGINPKKKLGQNFVTDANTIRRIIGMADILPDDTVLEVGPGLGSLTLGLLDVSRQVVAVEIDPQLAGHIHDTVAKYRPEAKDFLTVIRKDALRLSLEDFTQNLPSVLVANLPYNVAVPIMLHLLELLPGLRHGVTMVQEEVADRIAAPPGNKTYGAPSVKAAWYGSFRKIGVVSSKVFWPIPRVSSGLVTFDRRTPPSTSVSRTEVFMAVNAAFAHRRKTLRVALADWAGDAAHAQKYLIGAGIDPGVRGEKLGIHEFARISEQKALDHV